jgi:hypothetical protein
MNFLNNIKHKITQKLIWEIVLFSVGILIGVYLTLKLVPIIWRIF